MKPKITFSLSRGEATKLMKVLYDNFREDKDVEGGSFEHRLLEDLAYLLEVKPWDL